MKNKFTLGAISGMSALAVPVEANPNLRAVMHFGFGKGPHRHGPGHLAEKLGMTEAELKAALDSGKTIEQIAQEKGITLLPRPPLMGIERSETPAE